MIFCHEPIWLVKSSYYHHRHEEDMLPSGAVYRVDISSPNAIGNLFFHTPMISVQQKMEVGNFIYQALGQARGASNDRVILSQDLTNCFPSPCENLVKTTFCKLGFTMSWGEEKSTLSLHWYPCNLYVNSETKVAKWADESLSLKKLLKQLVELDTNDQLPLDAMAKIVMSKIDSAVAFGAVVQTALKIGNVDSQSAVYLLLNDVAYQYVGTHSAELKQYQDIWDSYIELRCEPRLNIS